MCLPWDRLARRGFQQERNKKQERNSFRIKYEIGIESQLLVSGGEVTAVPLQGEGVSVPHTIDPGPAVVPHNVLAVLLPAYHRKTQEENQDAVVSRLDCIPYSLPS